MEKQEKRSGGTEEQTTTHPERSRPTSVGAEGDLKRCSFAAVVVVKIIAIGARCSFDMSSNQTANNVQKTCAPCVLWTSTTFTSWRKPFCLILWTS